MMDNAPFFNTEPQQSPLGISIDSGVVDLTPKTQKSIDIGIDPQSMQSRTNQYINTLTDVAIGEIKKLEEKTRKQIDLIVENSTSGISSEIKKDIVDNVINELFSSESFVRKVNDLVKESLPDTFREMGESPKDTSNYRSIGSEPVESNNFVQIGSERLQSESYIPMGASRSGDDKFHEMLEDRSSSGSYRGMGESGEQNRQQQKKEAEKAEYKKPETEFGTNQLDWNNPMIVNEIILRQKRGNAGGGGVWSGYYWFGGGEGFIDVSDPANITGKYFGCNLKNGAVQFADSPSNENEVEWRYVANKDSITNEYSLSNRTSGDIVFRIT